MGFRNSYLRTKIELLKRDEKPDADRENNKKESKDSLETLKEKADYLQDLMTTLMLLETSIEASMMVILKLHSFFTIESEDRLKLLQLGSAFTSVVLLSYSHTNYHRENKNGSLRFRQCIPLF